jgi:hypothetical protein
VQIPLEAAGTRHGRRLLSSRPPVGSRAANSIRVVAAIEINTIGSTHAAIAELSFSEASGAPQGGGAGYIRAVAVL